MPRAGLRATPSCENEAMRYLGLACDYDGTVAHHGQVHEETIAALERVRASGRKLLLVTGRQLEDLLEVFARIDLFDRVVAECGLSPLFARRSMERALARAGVTATALTREGLKQALPEIRKSIEPFVERDAEHIMRRIERLAAA